MHRLTQQAFIYSSHGLYEAKDLQRSFKGIVSLLDRVFPRYGREKSLLDDWVTCSRYLPHVSSLARLFKASKRTKRKIESTDLFEELLKNATWYLQEIGEIQESEDLLDIAFEACQDEYSLTYAYLCNTKVVLAMDTNEIEEGHSYSQKAIAIREQHLAPDDIDLAISHGNFANILANEADFSEALKHLTIADNIWVGAGNTDDTYRALADLNIGRVYSLKGEPTTAVQYFTRAEEVFSKSSNNSFLTGYVPL
jgi:tetratricopeptide (TPR) repeat protein